MLYGDESANHATMRANEVQELLLWRIYHDLFGGGWLHDQFSAQSRKGVSLIVNVNVIRYANTTSF